MRILGFGPQALGALSILADPRSPDMRVRLNDKIKRRESFRPFAPAVLHEEADAWFEGETGNPYMSFLALSKRQNVPAITHVDGTARVQTVTRTRIPGSMLSSPHSTPERAVLRWSTRVSM